MDPYAKVWIDGEGTKSTHITKTAIKGDADPVWESYMDFGYVSVNKNNLLFIEIKHDGKIFDREIGLVKVPFSDLLAGDPAVGDKVTYPVTIKTGEKQGQVTFSYKFTDFVVKSAAADDDDQENVVGDDLTAKKKNGKGKEVAMNLASKLCMCATAAVADEGLEQVGFI